MESKEQAYREAFPWGNLEEIMRKFVLPRDTEDPMDQLCVECYEDYGDHDGHRCPTKGRVNVFRGDDRDSPPREG